MAYSTSVASTHFSRLAVGVSAADVALPANEAAWKALFASSANIEEVAHVRDFPSIGNNANIVNVPEYGRKITLSVNAQADAPSMELTLNFVPSEWDPTTAPGSYVGDGVVRAFQFALLPQAAASSAGTDIAEVPNAVIYFLGKIETHTINPSRDDAVTSTLTLSLASEVMGPYTI